MLRGRNYEQYLKDPIGKEMTDKYYKDTEPDDEFVKRIKLLQATVDTHYEQRKQHMGPRLDLSLLEDMSDMSNLNIGDSLEFHNKKQREILNELDHSTQEGTVLNR